MYQRTALVSSGSVYFCVEVMLAFACLLNYRVLVWILEFALLYLLFCDPAVAIRYWSRETGFVSQLSKAILKKASS
jgi:hypothetical protein